MKITNDVLDFFEAYDSVYGYIRKNGMLYFASEILEENEELLKDEYARWEHHKKGELR